MSIIHSRSPPFVPPPDDLTVGHFVLADSCVHHTKPVRPANVPCFIDEDTGRAVYSYELLQRSEGLARSVKGLWDIKPGDIVSVYSPNHIDIPVLYFAIHMLGATIAAHSAALTSEELVFQLNIAEPKILVVHPGTSSIALSALKSINFPVDRILCLGDMDSQIASTGTITLPFVQRLIAEQSLYRPYVERRLHPGEAKTSVAFLCFSSGTTGNPKAVKISHYNIMANLIQGVTHVSTNDPLVSPDDRHFRPGDIATGALPLYHMYGISQMYYCMFLGMTAIMSQTFNFEKFLHTIEKYGVTHLQLVPPIVVLLCKHPLARSFNLSSVRYCMVAAAPLSSELQEALLQLLPGIILGQGYGLTECTAAVTLFPFGRRVDILGSAGQLIPGTAVKAIKPDGTLARLGERGELWVQGPQVTLGYHRNEEATRETFIDGWLRTGDEVMFTKEEDMFVTDRIKELIKVKGLQVAPSELEGCLLDHPDIADAGVIAVSHEYTGEAPRAYVVLKPEVAAALVRNSALVPQMKEKIYKHVASVTARYKWLEGGIEFVDAIPKSPTGKILRRILKSRSDATPLPVKARL